jgi:hypothetical protein
MDLIDVLYVDFKDSLLDKRNLNKLGDEGYLEKFES